MSHCQDRNHHQTEKRRINLIRQRRTSNLCYCDRHGSQHFTNEARLSQSFNTAKISFRSIHGITPAITQPSSFFSLSFSRFRARASAKRQAKYNALHDATRSLPCVSVRAQLTAGMQGLPPGFALALLWDHGTHGLAGARRAAARHVKPARRRH